MDNISWAYLHVFRKHRLVGGEIDFSVLRTYSIIAAGIAGILEGTCMAIYGCLVAIGSKHGMINVYHLEKDWDKQVSGGRVIIWEAIKRP